MDEQLEALRRFDSELRAFNEELRHAFADLEARQEATLPTWDDSVRRMIETRIEDARGPIEGYLQREAETFERFVAERIRRLEGYLHGR